MKQIMIWLILTILIKSLIWSLLIPLWHTPDEQAHFGHVAFIAEGGDYLHQGRYLDMSEEIYTSLDILGTKRDEQGNNKFTFHPEYRLDYSSNFDGPREKEIKSLPLAARKNFVIKESAYYPHFFYQISSFIYKLFYSSDLFVRVFSLRLFWLPAHLLMLWFIYKIARLCFPKNNLLVLTATILAGFQPMLSFVSAGVTGDNLHNLLFTAIIYFSLKIIASPRWFDYLGLTLSLGLGLVNKQQFFLAFLIIIPSLILSLINHPRKTYKFWLFFPLAIALVYLLDPERFNNILKLFLKGQIPYFSFKAAGEQIRPGYSLWEHFIWTLQHTIKEVLPWYWGVFNWLGVVLPRWVNRVLMRILVVAGLGLIVRLIKIIKEKKITQTDFFLIFLTWTAFSYSFGLMLWDWNHVKNVGFPFGFQGRYYFPVIASHLILLTFGIKEFFGLFGEKIARYSLLILSIWFIILGGIGLYTMAQSYYDVANFKNFIIQASQYKPFFAKSWWLTSALGLYLAGCIGLIWRLIKYEK